MNYGDQIYIFRTATCDTFAFAVSDERSRETASVVYVGGLGNRIYGLGDDANRCAVVDMGMTPNVELRGGPLAARPA